MTGWYPKITAKEGVHKLYNWLKETQPINNMMLSSKIL
jgi:nucleoside-diphosphate-sugar epimerase